eukprot:CAMPEP_0182910876 /NCGR_PEP_ID=MMETSP0034_2-20130328/36584_1 /TAXON_ID=156128 /ORGANISM="Nephroselmis pyriformis, Strain CCMP717" /LENGTH=80 /DNA_ID=CAMNT_0025047299 /DNA_START=47 /DNA_END=286 /DNA_ORIENTATION=+
MNTPDAPVAAAFWRAIFLFCCMASFWAWVTSPACPSRRAPWAPPGGVLTMRVPGDPEASPARPSGSCLAPGTGLGGVWAM